MNKKIFKYLNTTISTKKYYVAILLLIQVATAFFSVISVLELKNLIDAAVSQNILGLKKYALIFVGLAILSISLSAINRYFTELSTSTYENLFKKRIFNNILNKDYALIKKTHSGEWLNKITSDTKIVADNYASLLPNFLGSLIKFVTALIYLIILIPGIIYAIIPTLFVLGLVTYKLRNKLKDYHTKVRVSDGKLRVFLSERISNLIIIKAFSKEESTLIEADKYLDDFKDSRMSRVKFSTICNIGFSVISTGMYVASAIVCAYLIFNGSITYGTFIAVVQLVTSVKNPLINITGYVPRYYSLIASVERLMEVEDYLVDNVDQYDQDTVNEYYDNKFKKLGLKNINFKYDEEYTLTNFSFELKKGQIVGLVGDSGIGKSTVLKLLMCLYDVDGNRYIDNQILDSKYRKLFAYVPQQNNLLAGRIKDVISFNEPVDEDRLKYACKVAIVDFIDDYNMAIGENGFGLSEGQMQRIAIARAIYSNKPIILLDESTSGLDSKTEKKLLHNIKKLTDKSIVIVTHRKSTLVVCDKVVKI